MKPHHEYPQSDRIETPRLILRPMREEDAACVVQWRSNPEDAISYASSQPPTLASHLDWFRGPRNGRIDYMIELRADHRAIGTVHFKNIIENAGTAESGRLIGDLDCRGCGYGRESAIAWLRFGFEVLGLKKIYGITHVGNEANISLNRSLGYRVESIGPADHVPQDFLKMELTIEEGRNHGIFSPVPGEAPSVQDDKAL